MVPPEQEQDARAFVSSRWGDDVARLTYQLGGSLKYELDARAVTAGQVFDAMTVRVGVPVQHCWHW